MAVPSSLFFALPDRSVGTGTLEELLGPIEDGAAIAM
jgi:hypothetical protein